MKKLFSTIAIVATSTLALGSAAHATFVDTTASFFTPTSNGTLTFTYEGFSAADTDAMTFTFNGNPIFINKTAAPGNVITESVISGQVYKLTLTDTSVANIWSSDPALNTADGGKAHLALTDTFSDFNLPGHPNAPFPVTTNCVGGGLSCYLGWEDRPNPNPNNPLTDFNDLVFAEQFTPTTVTGTPEPASMTLLGSGLIALGMMMRRRRRKAA
jgi:PEP-CTERM motif